ncbi:MAG TPA: hypothetical protein DIS79_03775 [Bacteroidetes bacterium]|nr:hypothetical protein [Bacteroidota bacterium]HRK03977.1 ferritin-like domain-containing protein [Chlorobiota bacterium]
MKLSSSAKEQADMLEEVLHDVVDPRRRGFLKKGALAAAAVAALPIVGSTMVSCSSDSPAAPTDESNSRDIKLLTDAYLIEKLAVNTYVAAAGLGILSGAFLDVAQSFAADHIGHAGTFRDVITGELRAAPPIDPKNDENFITGMMVNGETRFRIPPAFGNLTSAAGIVKYALALELTAAKAYFDNAASLDAGMRLTNRKAIDAVSDIGPVEAEHAAVFRAALKLLLASDTDADAGSDVGRSVSPTSFISAEMPRP